MNVTIAVPNEIARLDRTIERELDVEQRTWLRHERDAVAVDIGGADEREGSVSVIVDAVTRFEVESGERIDAPAGIGIDAKRAVVAGFFRIAGRPEMPRATALVLDE